MLDLRSSPSRPRLVAAIALAVGSLFPAAALRAQDRVQKIVASADALLRSSHFDSSRTAYEKALGSGTKNRGVIVAANRGIGRGYIEIGRPDTALMFLRRATVPATGINRDTLALTLGDIAEALLDPEVDSVDAAAVALADARRISGVRKATEAAVLRVSGLLHLAKVRQARRARMASRAAAGPTDADKVVTLTATIRGLRDAAIGDLSRASRLSETDTTLKVAILNALIAARLEQDNSDSTLEAAEELAWEALSLQDTSAETLARATSLTLLARSLERKGDEVRAHLNSAAAVHDAIRSRIRSPDHRVTYAERVRDTYERWAWAWASHQSNSAQGLAAAERGRMREFLRMLEDTDTLNLLKDLVTEGARHVARVKDDRGAGVLYYVQTERGLVIWYVSPDGKVYSEPKRAVTPDSMWTLVAALHRAVGSAWTDSLRASFAPAGTGEADVFRSRVGGASAPVVNVETVLSALSTILLPRRWPYPAASRDTSAESREMLIIPYGIIGLVPFAALTVPGETQPLGARFSLRYGPSLESLETIDDKRGRDDSRKRQQLLLEPSRSRIVGNPTMPVVVTDSGPRTLPPLRFAQEEAQSVAAMLKTTADTGGSERATESSVLIALQSADLVHLATHGYAVTKATRVRDSYLALARGSGDGLLTLHDLADLDVTAELVVLSACQTALGYTTSVEGVIGFPRSFLGNGAKSVIVSLWSVNDRTTSVFMREFYRHWLGIGGVPKRSKSDALRRAQVATRRESPNLRDWAAFQLVGGR